MRMFCVVVERSLGAVLHMDSTLHAGPGPAGLPKATSAARPIATAVIAWMRTGIRCKRPRGPSSLTEGRWNLVVGMPKKADRLWEWQECIPYLFINVY